MKRSLNSFQSHTYGLVLSVPYALYIIKMPTIKTIIIIVQRLFIPNGSSLLFCFCSFAVWQKFLGCIFLRMWHPHATSVDRDERSKGERERERAKYRATDTGLTKRQFTHMSYIFVAYTKIVYALFSYCSYSVALFAKFFFCSCFLNFNLCCLFALRNKLCDRLHSDDENGRTIKFGLHSLNTNIWEKRNRIESLRTFVKITCNSFVC